MAKEKARKQKNNGDHSHNRKTPKPVLSVPNTLCCDGRGSAGGDDRSGENESRKIRSSGNGNMDRSYPIYLEEDWDSGIGGGVWTTGMMLAKYIASRSPCPLRGEHPDQNHFLNQFRLIRERKRKVSSEKERKSNGLNDDDATIRVLELGSGNGFLSVCLIVAIAIAEANNDGGDGSCWPNIEVVVTDTAEHLDLIRRNIESNLRRILPTILKDRRAARKRIQQAPQQQIDDDYNDDEGGIDRHVSEDNTDSLTDDELDVQSIIDRVVIIKEYLWGEPYDFSKNKDINNNSSAAASAATELNSGDNEGEEETNVGICRHQTFDLIIGSDVAYSDKLYDPLISALREFTGAAPSSYADMWNGNYFATTVALIGVTMNDTKPLFFHKLKDAGFTYEKLSNYLFDDEFTSSDQFGIFYIYPKPKEKVHNSKPYQGRTDGKPYFLTISR